MVNEKSEQFLNGISAHNRTAHFKFTTSVQSLKLKELSRKT